MRAALLLSAAMLAASAAHAQTYDNSQYQGGDARATTHVDVGSADDVGATAVAAGAVATVTAEDSDIRIDNSQHTDGDVSAEANAVAWSAHGVAISSAAVSNGLTASNVNGSMDIDSDQRAHGNASASTRFTGGDASYASTSASASGNTAAVSSEYGDVLLRGYQESTGSVSASVEADHCCIAGQVVSGAVASANNIAASGNTTTSLSDITQRATGESVSARVDLYAGYATDASGNATANANSVTIDNQWGYVNSRIGQSSSANVAADSYVTLGGDFLGLGSAGAYGVGNQALVSNVGSDTVLDVTQDNTGDISANAAMVGEGGDALASAAAYGNTVTGSLCSYCDQDVPGLSAHNDQRNSGDVSASAAVNTQRDRSVAATATAIGNAATYSTQGPGDRP